MDERHFAVVYFITWLIVWWFMYQQDRYDFDLAEVVAYGAFALVIAAVLLGLIGVMLFLGAVALGVVVI